MKVRETNFQRACKTLRDLLKGNTRFKHGEVASVDTDEDGIEVNLQALYSK